MNSSETFNINKLRTSEGNTKCVPPAEEKCLFATCKPNLVRVSQLSRPAKFWVCSTVLSPTRTQLPFTPRGFYLFTTSHVSSSVVRTGLSTSPKMTKPFSRDRLMAPLTSETGRTESHKKLSLSKFTTPSYVCTCISTLTFGKDPSTTEFSGINTLI